MKDHCTVYKLCDDLAFFPSFVFSTSYKGCVYNYNDHSFAKNDILQSKRTKFHIFTSHFLREVDSFFPK